MRHYNKLISVVVLVAAAALILISAGCFGSNNYNSDSGPSTPTVVKPKPRVDSITATTIGSEDTYAAILRFKVKNEGAGGTVLIRANITQGGKTVQNETPVYDLKQGESREIVLKPFPLVWEGGDFTTTVQAVIP